MLYLYHTGVIVSPARLLMITCLSSSPPGPYPLTSLGSVGPTVELPFESIYGELVIVDCNAVPTEFVNTPNSVSLPEPSAILSNVPRTTSSLSYEDPKYVPGYASLSAIPQT